MNGRFLFIRLSALGDIVCTLPALRALAVAHPGARVDWVVEDRFAPLLHLVEGIERVVVFPRRQLAVPGPGALRALLAERSLLRQERYDAAIDFQGNLKGAAHLLAARADLRIGLDRGAAREGAHRAAGVRVALPPRVHRAERALRLLAPLGVPVPPLPDGVLPPALRPVFHDLPAAAEDVERRLRAVSGTGPVVVLHPGTSPFGRFKRWPPAAFGLLARDLRESRDARVLVSHGPGEETLAAATAAAAGGAALVHAPAHGLAGLVALLGRADVMVAADSGPLLLASALGTRTVALFGPKDPARYAPPFGDSAVVRHDVPCAPCSLRRCPDPVCVTGIPVEEVARVTRRLLAERQPAC